MEQIQKNKLKYAIVFCDIDDTLLNDKLKISELTKTAICRFTSFGGRFVLVTGRNYSSTRRVYEELNLDTLLIVNQGTVYDPSINYIHHQKVFDTVNLAKMCEFLEQKSIYFQLFCNNVIYVEKMTDYSHRYIQRCGVKICETNVQLSSFVEKNKMLFDKLMLECDEKLIDDIFSDISERFCGIFDITRSKSWIVEVAPSGSTKGAAVEFILRKYCIHKEQAMAIGDSDNDLSMFNSVGFSVAVSNSSPSIIKRADAVTKSNNNNGVGYALEKYVYNYSFKSEL